MNIEFSVARYMSLTKQHVSNTIHVSFMALLELQECSRYLNRPLFRHRALSKELLGDEFYVDEASVVQESPNRRLFI